MLKGYVSINLNNPDIELENNQNGVLIMRKLVLFGLLMLTIVVVSCAPPSNEESEALAGQAIRTTKEIKMGETFVLPFSYSGEGDSVGEILEYTRSDRITKTNPSIRFKIWRTGEAYETTLSGNGEATLSFNDRSYLVRLMNPNKDN